ncbi:unnamed protein product [Toxocara canis]|uniref:Uncharacterized protein n=1 Tax=Toxocara canis TaxID=6265 RepID=A0A183V939_TOXCA|nr:unnamed protein product [Toxocara canis]
MASRSNLSFELKALANALALLSQRVAHSLKTVFTQQQEEVTSKMGQLTPATTSLTQAISTTSDADSSSSRLSSATYSTAAQVVHTAVLQEKAKRCVFFGVHCSRRQQTIHTSSLS